MIDVCCALIFQQGLLLAVQRGNGHNHPFQWEFPGGKLESGESLTDCIIREIKEELQLDIQPLKQLGYTEHQYPDKLIRLIPFVCKPVSNRLQLTEHIQHKWIKTNELDSLNWQEADQWLIEQNKTEILDWFRENDDKS